MQTKLIVSWKWCLLVLVFLLFAGTQIAHAQPGFGQEWQKSPIPLFPAVGSGLWNSVPSTSVLILGHGLFDGTEFKIYFAGSNGEKFSIGYVNSTTLDSGWVSHAEPVLTAGPVGSWDEAGVGNPVVVKDGTTFKMWYAGLDTFGITRIGYATSADGISWTKFENNPVLDVVPGTWESVFLLSPYVIKDGSTYKMWYAGTDSVAQDTVVAWAIGYASSPDGINWTRAAENPVLQAGPDGSWEDAAFNTPTVLFENGKFLMWYVGNDIPITQGGKSQTGFAMSDDGINWTKDPSNPVLATGDTSDFDFAAAVGIQVFKVDSVTYKMVYGATNLTTFFGGLLATLDLTTSVEDVGGDIPTDFALHQNYPNPFNPTTTIQYSLSSPAKVTLTIYNTLGQEVRTLVNQNQSPGLKSMVWDGKNDLGKVVNSGIYFYTLQAGDRVQTKKMLLIK